MGKVIATVISIIFFINAAASDAVYLLTQLQKDYPDSPKLKQYAFYSTLVVAAIAPFLPRLQKLNNHWDEAKLKHKVIHQKLD